MTSLDDWLVRIGEIHPVGWDLGLDRVRTVGERLDLLHPAKKVVLVAGTNGKGSTCEAISRLLVDAGERVGKSTSPHLFQFNERIQINDQPVSDAEIVDAFSRIDQVRGDVTLTYFEFSTLAAMLVFSRSNLDVALLEIGLGGRLDAMNIASPDLCIITSIALDHQSYLGDTRHEIAIEKAGIMRTGVPCLIADLDPEPVLQECADKLAAPVRYIGKDFPTYESSGSHLPAESCAAALAAVAELGVAVTTAMQASMDDIELPGRMTQRTLDGRRLVFDVAHNPAAAIRLADSIRSSVLRDGSATVHALVGIYRDKDADAVFKPFLELVSHWYCTAAEEERALPPEELKAKILALNPTGESGIVKSYDKIESASKAVEVASRDGDLILVFGSFPIVADAMTYFEQNTNS